MARLPCMSTGTMMRLRNEDVERCYQLVMKRIAQYDLDETTNDPGYRIYLVNESARFIDELVRRRKMIA